MKSNPSCTSDMNFQECELAILRSAVDKAEEVQSKKAVNSPNMQKMIRIAFTNCTVLTIAHRLDTVIDSDYILVMDKGSCVEFGSPQELLKDKDGLFTSLYEKFNLKE